MKIYLIRHGITNSNKIGILNGQAIDEGIEEEGVSEIEETAKIIPGDISKMYASDMLRTRQTAEIINKFFNIDVEYCKELREVDFGIFSGKSLEEIKKIAGENFWDKYRNQEYDFTPYKGESINDVKRRVLRLIEKIKKENDKEVLLVTHGGIIRFFYFLYKNDTHFHGAKNASIHEFEI